MNKINFRNIFIHLKTILVHKFWVFVYCCKLGIPWQGVTHDLSKFSWIEFKESVIFCQGGKKSPIPKAKETQGYSLAWQHHKGRNKHHYEYWTDNYDNQTTAIEMPEKYVRELVADWLAAGRTYNGRSFTIYDEIDWWENSKDYKLINDNTKYRISEILYGLIPRYKYHKDGFYEMEKGTKVFENKATEEA